MKFHHVRSAEARQRQPQPVKPDPEPVLIEGDAPQVAVKRPDAAPRVVAPDEPLPEQQSARPVQDPRG